MWLLLNGLSVGQVLLGGAIAVAASSAMAALQPAKPRIGAGTCCPSSW